MTRMLTVTLAVLMALSLLSCSLLTTEEVLTVYVASEAHTVDCIAIAPEPDVMNSGKKIILFDYTEMMQPKSSKDYHVDIPDSQHDGTWYIYVSGAVKGFLEMYSYEENVGELFTGEVYGFSIDFEDEAKTFVLTPLSGV